MPRPRRRCYKANAKATRREYRIHGCHVKGESRAVRAAVCVKTAEVGRVGLPGSGRAGACAPRVSQAGYAADVMDVMDVMGAKRSGVERGIFRAGAGTSAVSLTHTNILETSPADPHSCSRKDLPKIWSTCTPTKTYMFLRLILTYSELWVRVRL